MMVGMLAALLVAVTEQVVPAEESNQVSETTLVIWNGDLRLNDGFMSTVADVSLRSNGGSVLWEKKSVAVSSSNTVVRLPNIDFARVRITVTRWTGSGGGLSEVEVLKGGENVALGCKVNASSAGSMSLARTKSQMQNQNVKKPDNNFSSYRVTNGVRCGDNGNPDSTHHMPPLYEGGWRLPANTPGWVEIVLGEKDSGQPSSSVQPLSRPSKRQ